MSVDTELHHRGIGDRSLDHLVRDPCVDMGTDTIFVRGALANHSIAPM